VTPGNTSPALDKGVFVCYIIVVKGTMKIKFETGTIVSHRDSPSWKAVVIKDIFPRRSTWGMVKVVTLNTNVSGRGFVTNMPKSLLRRVETKTMKISA